MDTLADRHRRYCRPDILQVPESSAKKLPFPKVLSVQKSIDVAYIHTHTHALNIEKNFNIKEDLAFGFKYVGTFAFSK
jgi:hypothetical protein